MPAWAAAAEVAPEVLPEILGSGAIEGGAVEGGAFDGLGGDASMGGGLDAGGQGGFMSYLNGFGGFLQSNPKLSTLLGLGGLSALNSRNIQNQNAQISREAQQRQLARQALMDNPPPFAAMSGPGVTPTNNWGSNVASRPSFSYADLKSYGAGPERHWAASGGLAMHAPMHGHGGLDQAMVDEEGGGQEDNVPAMLSPKEYVLDADVVSALGDGNPDEGARRLDAFRERVRAHKRGAPTHRIPPKAHPIENYMRRAA